MIRYVLLAFCISFSFLSFSQNFNSTGNKGVDSTISFYYPKAGQSLVDSIVSAGILKTIDPVLYMATTIKISGRSFYRKSYSKIASEVFSKFEENFVDQDYSIEDVYVELNKLFSDSSIYETSQNMGYGKEKVFQQMENEVWEFTRLKLYPSRTGGSYFPYLYNLCREDGFFLSNYLEVPDILFLMEEYLSPENRVHGYLLLCNDLLAYGPYLLEPYLDSIAEIIYRDKEVDQEDRAMMYIALSKLYNSVDYQKNYMLALNLLLGASTYLENSHAAIEKRLAVHIMIARSLSVLPGVEPREQASLLLSDFYARNIQLMDENQRMKCLTMQLYFESITYETRYIESYITKGLAYLHSIYAPDKFSYLPTKKNGGKRLDLVDIGGTFYDLDKGFKDWKSASLTLTAERLICFVYNKNTGLLLYLEDSGKLKIHGVKLFDGRTTHIKKALKMCKSEVGVFYNPELFIIDPRNSDKVVVVEELRVLTNQKLSVALRNPEQYSEEQKTWYNHETTQREQLLKVKGRLRDKLLMQ